MLSFATKATIFRREFFALCSFSRTRSNDQTRLANSEWIPHLSFQTARVTSREISLHLFLHSRLPLCATRSRLCNASTPLARGTERYLARCRSRLRAVANKEIRIAARVTSLSLRLLALLKSSSHVSVSFSFIREYVVGPNVDAFVSQHLRPQS